VWAFGILLWELFSEGNLPYPGMSNKETTEQVLKGYRMTPPENCPVQISQLMKKCWSHKPEDRPSFKEIHSTITQNIGIVVPQQIPSENASQLYMNV